MPGARWIAAATLVAGWPTPARAEDGVCHIVEVDFTPAEIATPAAMRAPSQIVAWIEDPASQLVETIFITQETGTYGLGNRPGRFDFNSGPAWPYGRRITVFPVWGHRRAASGAPQFPEIVFQDGSDSNLSHSLAQSSPERHFCRPMLRDEPEWDAGSCASANVGTDKGLLGPRQSLYPPRNDLVLSHEDDPSAAMYTLLNPFDAVSQATPASGVPARFTWNAPGTVPPGNYTVWLEVAREFDHNATYSIAARPSPANIPWREYGEPYRGQPSVVYRTPIALGTEAVTTTLDYAGYGDPDGADGNVREPDSTISTGVAGSGAERLAIRADGGTPYRVRVTTRTERDAIRPAAPGGAEVNTLSSTTATIQFTAPGDDDQLGRVAGYEIRYVAGPSLDEASFATAMELKPMLAIGEAGTVEELTLDGLLYDTEYTVGIRAIDDCRNRGALTFVTFRTTERPNGTVEACFIATAAYGSVMANDVEMLRRFRDLLLQNTVLGELAVEAYYTFGPAVSGVIGESEVLRTTARSALAPLVVVARAFRF
ncbi:MAG: hypothetical protein H0T89_21010 [Deltaproteobacteria bacterium]|nr:hypothetical protein [Deltaproteobacteria bacterium]MDQ3297117.1 hypothetical protein [Myxococcota bacterium]